MAVVIERMDALVDRWGASDRRSLFAGAYRSMSASMMSAVDSGEFDDPEWVGHLLTNFAEYYFSAVDAFESGAGQCPRVWKMAFDATVEDTIHPLRMLFLGINAHINYDLALCVAEVMSDWGELGPSQRGMRQRDYDMVDTIIHRTVDAVQDGVVAPASPGMGIFDKMMGPLDEWLVASLISRWRRDTWGDALKLLGAGSDGLAEVRTEIEAEALHTAEWIVTVGPG